jgi:hypothetical protein
MVRQETATHPEQQPPFDPELFAALVAAMRNENQRALIEYDRYPHAEREAAWRDSAHYARPETREHGRSRALFEAENLVPAALLPARNRLSQTLGSFCAAFRGSGRRVNWFASGDDSSAMTSADETDSDPRVCVSPSFDPNDGFSLSLRNDAFVVSFCYSRQPPPHRLDPSFFPATLTTLRLEKTVLSGCDTSDFLVKLTACPRLKSLLCSFTGLIFEFKLKLLAPFSELLLVSFSYTCIWCDPEVGLDWDELPPSCKLQNLTLDYAHRLKGVMKGTRPQSLTYLYTSGTGLRSPDQ